MRRARHGLEARAHGLVHIYRADGHDVAALGGIDLVVPAGDSVALLGPSGAGKSTLLSVFGGLLRPSAGRVHVGEHELSRMSHARLDRIRGRDIGLVLQGAARNLLSFLTPAQNIAFAASGAKRSSARSADELLDLVDLVDRRGTRVDRLSPGERQRLAVAVGVAAGPGLLLADEPTAALHHEAKLGVIDVLHRINEVDGTTVMVVTHDAELARAMRRTVTIRDGRVGAEGRGGDEFAVVAADSSLPLPTQVSDDLPPGTLVRVLREEGRGWLLQGVDADSAEEFELDGRKRDDEPATGEEGQV